MCAGVLTIVNGTGTEASKCELVPSNFAPFFNLGRDNTSSPRNRIDAHRRLHIGRLRLRASLPDVDMFRPFGTA